VHEVLVNVDTLTLVRLRLELPLPVPLSFGVVASVAVEHAERSEER
jgi:hypothetical protein